MSHLLELYTRIFYVIQSAVFLWKRDVARRESGVKAELFDNHNVYEVLLDTTNKSILVITFHRFLHEMQLIPS